MTSCIAEQLTCGPGHAQALPSCKPRKKNKFPFPFAAKPIRSNLKALMFINTVDDRPQSIFHHSNLNTFFFHYLIIVLARQCDENTWKTGKMLFCMTGT
jgi:hypothetical protein